MRKTRVGRYSKQGLREAMIYENCFSSICTDVSNSENYGNPLRLEPWQRDNIWKPLFGTGKMEGGSWVRRYGRALIGLPREYGKTVVAAGIILTVATMEPVWNGLYGVVADSEHNASNLFEKLCGMIRVSPTLDAQWEIFKKEIRHRETGARIMVMPYKEGALQGWHFNVLVFDEMHVYRSAAVWEAGISGQKTIRNSLTIGITTAADTQDGFLYELFEKNDPGRYTYWLGIDEGDDPYSERTWKKILIPSWVSLADVRDQYDQLSKRSFIRYILNAFPADGGDYHIFSVAQIRAITKTRNQFDFDHPFLLAIDGATGGDSFAIIAYQVAGGIGYTHEWVFDEPGENGHYNLREIAELVSGLCQKHEVPLVAIDPSRLLLLAQYLQDEFGVPIAGVAQSNQNMCPASSLVTNSAKDRLLCLSGCPKLQRQMLNVVEDDKQAWGTRFGKDKRRSLIDAPIALAIAMFAWSTMFNPDADYLSCV